MKKVFSIITLSTLVLASCSSSNVNRTIAHEVHPDAKDALESLFTIKASNMSLAEEDLEKKVLNNLKTFTAGAEIEIVLIEDDKLIDETLFKIEPIIENNKHLLIIRHAEDAFKDHAATLNLTRFMEELIRSKSPSFFELYYKALSNDLASLHTVAKIRRLILTPLENNAYYEPINLSQYNGYVQGEIIIWNKKLAVIAKKQNAKKAQTP